MSPVRRERCESSELLLMAAAAAADAEGGLEALAGALLSFGLKFIFFCGGGLCDIARRLDELVGKSASRDLWMPVP